jgi:thymidylate synthase (FAD)
MTAPRARAAAPDLDRVLGETFPVLDDGFVRAVDYLGNDAAIVQAARVSYGAGTKQVRDDTALIRYLMQHAHTSPFEMCELTLHVRAPMDCWRQWVRHRTASVNEYSTRYSVAIDAAQRTPPEGWRTQAQDNRQGSGGAVGADVGAELSAEERALQEHARKVYERRLAAGVAREQARKDLPLSTYTEAYWKIDLHNLFHFLELRLDARAQAEIRAYAQAIAALVQRWCPVAYQAFVDFRLEAMRLSRPEIAVLRALARSPEDALRAAREERFLGDAGAPERRRERAELERKMDALGIAVPWERR